MIKKITNKIKQQFNVMMFGFFGQKPVQTGLAWFFWLGSVFFRFGFGLVFSVSDL